MKKIALLLGGQSKNYTMSHLKKEYTDYKKHLSILSKIKENNKDFDFDIFFHTYNSELLDKNELLQDLEPKDYIITESPIDDKYCKAQSKIGKNIFYSVESVINLYLNYCKENNVAYDGVVMCRFDFYPDEDINFNIINFEKINIYKIFYHKNKIHTRDNLLYTNNEGLEIYKNAMNKRNPFSGKHNVGNLHWVCGFIDKNLLEDLYIEEENDN